MTPIEYVTTKEKRKSATYYYSGTTGKGQYYFKGHIFEEQEFDLLFPIDSLQIKAETKESKGANPDTRHNFLYQ